MLQNLQINDFTPLLNQAFRVHVGPDECVAMELIRVQELGQPPASEEEFPRRQSFSLIFRGAKGLALPQAIYPVEHEQLGSTGIFLVPIGPDDAGMRYEAIFS